MKTIDFTHPGGFPLTQDQLDYLQQAYKETINVLAALGSDGTTPALMSGMVQSTPSPGTTAVTDGWFFYNNEMVPFTGASVTPASGNFPIVQLTANSTNLVYNDGSSYPAVLSKTATLTSGPATTGPLQFPLSSLLPYQQLFGLNGRESSWNTIGVGTPTAQGNVTGTIFYKKNLITNTLQIRGTLTANVAQNFAASPAALYYLMNTLPAGYAPTNTAYFTAYYFAANLFKDDVGVAWVKQVNSLVNSSGQILINFLKPDSAILAYSVVFNTVIPLD